MSGESNEPKLTRPTVDSARQPATGRLGAVGLQGHVDAIESGRIYGWAWNPEAPDAHVSVDIHYKGALIGHAMANRYRQDLADLQMADGTHAFVYDLPSPAREADSMAVSVYFTDTQMPLSRGGSGELPTPDPNRGTVDLLSGRVDRMEASLQQVYRAVHLIRSRDDDHLRGANGAEAGLLQKDVLELRERHNLLAAQIENLAREINHAISLADRLELESQTHSRYSTIDNRLNTLKRNIFLLFISMTMLFGCGIIGGFLLLT